jgi:hypothetical protein
MTQRPDVKLWQPHEVVANFTCREHERDPLRQQAVSHERERSPRCPIQPLRVIDDTQERTILPDLGQQAQNGQPDQQGIRSRPCSEPERDVERCALGIWESVHDVQGR